MPKGMKFLHTPASACGSKNWLKWCASTEQRFWILSESSSPYVSNYQWLSTIMFFWACKV